MDVVRTWNDGEVAHLYRVPLRAGDALRVAVEQKSSDILLEVLAPGEKEPIVVDGYTYATGTDAFELVAAASGEARVRVLLGTAVGATPGYRLVISPLHPATPVERLRALSFAAFEAANGASDESAIRTLKRALRWAEQARARDLEALIHGRLGRRLPPEDPAALRNLRLAVTLADEPQLHGAGLHRLGILLGNQLDRGAAPAFEQELRTGVRSGNLYLQAFALGGLGWLAERRGAFEESLARYRESLALWRRLGDRDGQAQTLNNLGSVALSLGDPERGLIDLRAGLALDPPDFATRVRLLDDLGLALRRLEEWDRARAISSQALAGARRLRDRRREASCLLTLGSMELDLGRTQAALSFLKPAEKILHEVHNPASLANVEVMLGVVATRKGDLPEAFLRFDRSLKGYLALDDRNAMAWVLSYRSDALRQAGRLPEARADLRQAIAILESLRPDLEPQKRAQLLADRHRFFERLVDLLVAEHRPELAFEASERARARTLLDQVSGRKITPPRSLAEIRAAIPPGAVLLDFWLGQERSFVWVVRAEGLSLAILPAQGAIEAQGRLATGALGSRPGRLAQRERRIAALAQTLFSPIASGLKADRFVVVPDGELFEVPFAALPIPGSGGDEPDRLIDRAPVVTLPSASLALEIRDAVARRPAADGGLFAVGDPVFGCPDDRLGCRVPTPKMAQASLPERLTAKVRAFLPPPKEERDATSGELPRIARTGSEVAAIVRLAGAGNVSPRLGFEANRSVVLGSPLEGYRILHFATHGLVDPVRPERSGLALARRDRVGGKLAGDTFLRLGDLAGRKLRADLIVLSACESAVGREKRGEGPQSLGRAFLAAGAANALVSLWRVDDRSTEELMIGFYRQLLERGLSPAAALRESQLAVRSRPEWRDPYYWGAFVLQGDWR
ncbi:MAG TPA: CHAT domain-containing tetratricopeptide repeat protein [Thermoanaerobaculia bacterium]|nr:CHAT domain-containing tetratricopeptide repeat protein [Thermoanaerobaculia bacterium]